MANYVQALSSTSNQQELGVVAIHHSLHTALYALELRATEVQCAHCVPLSVTAVQVTNQ